jgi:outer membrane protein, heavy metal efflux system
MISRLRCACIAAVFTSAVANAQERDPGLHELANARALDPAMFVRAVLHVNPSIEAARQGWRAALARVQQAGAFDDPMVKASLAPLSLGSSAHGFGFEVGLSQALPWFGKRSLEREVMQAEAAASASDLEGTRRELAMAAFALCTTYYVVQRSLEINAQFTELMRAASDAAEAQLQTGRATVQDALQAEAELAQLERSTLELTAERDVIVAQMNELLHREPAAPLPPAANALDAPPRARDLRRLTTEALNARPEITAARLHARAQALKAEAAEREYYPNFTLSTSYSSMWNMPEHRWMFGVGINVPLPTEQRAGAIEEARASRARYESVVARMSAAARTEVYVALRRLEESERLLVLFRDRLAPIARQRADAARVSFTSSQAPFISVIEAQRSLRSVELEQEVTRAAYVRRAAELDRVLGRIPGMEAGGEP